MLKRQNMEMWKRRNKKEFEMLAVKCLLVLDSFYVTMKDTVVSFDAIVYSKQKIGTKKCLQTFYASTRGPSVSNPVHLLGIRWTTRFRILLSVKVLEIKQMLQLLISCLWGHFSFGSCVGFESLAFLSSFEGGEFSVVLVWRASVYYVWKTSG